MTHAKMPNAGPVSYPGIPTVTDGTGSVVWVETAISEAATAYPITPTTNMGVGYQEYVANGATNLWGTPLGFVELESEHSSASSCEGFAAAGGRVTNFTSGQGLVLMKEVLYTIAGKRLPVVFNIGARALTHHSLNVHCGHDDIFGVLDTNWGCLFGRNAQEAADFCLIARRAAEASQTPFFNVQDGFLITHTLENVKLPELELMKQFVGDPKDRVLTLLDPHKPMMVGVVQNQDSYMKGKIAQRGIFDKVRAKIQEAMHDFGHLTGRNYDMVTTVGMEDAEVAIVGLGSSMETAEAVLPQIRAMGIKLGLVHINVLRPFPDKEIVQALRACRAVAVIERMDAPLGQSNPLATEVKAALFDALRGREGLPKLALAPNVVQGIYGLGSRDFRPSHVIAIAKELASQEPREVFVVGVRHPLALAEEPEPTGLIPGAFSMRGHSVGGYGSVTTNKILATLAGDVFGTFVQAYPKYGSEKKGLPTTYYLTLASERIKTHCELNEVDFVALNDINAFKIAGPLAGLKQGGTLFIQSAENDPAKVWAAIPAQDRKRLADKGAKVIYLDAVKLARELAPSIDLAQRMQGIVLLGVFLRVTPYQKQLGLSDDDLFAKVRKPLEKYFGRRGEAVIEANLNAVKRGFAEAREIPAGAMAPVAV